MFRPFNAVSFKSRPRAGFTVIFDPSSLSAVTRNRVRKWLAQGYCEASHGHAAGIADMYWPGIPRIGKNYADAQIPSNMPEESRVALAVMHRLLKPSNRTVFEEPDSNTFCITGWKNAQPIAKKLIKKLAADPFFDEYKRAAVEKFDRAEKLMLVGGGEGAWRPLP